MASIPETLYTKAGVDAAIAAALTGFTGGGLTVIDNGDGTGTVAAGGPTGSANLVVVDNGDGTYTTTYSPTGGSSSVVLIDNGNGTYTITQ